MHSPHLSIKIGLRHGEDPNNRDSWEIVGGLLSASEARDDFMPFRLKNSDPRYERVILARLEPERDGRFSRDTSEGAKPAKSKK